MSSRQEEKERRRGARLAAEREAAARDARRRRLGLAVGGGLAAVAAVIVVIALTAGGGSKKKPDESAAKLDAAVQARASAAGCTAQAYPNFGRNHVDGKVKYATNPPTSGDHNPTPASDGIYDPGGTPQVEKLVHALEHGRVQYQYRPGTPKSVVNQLQALMTEPGANGRPAGYNQLFYENTTGMRYQVAATAWRHLLGCPRFRGAATLAALRAFRDAYTDKAPELIQAPE
jgi:hypothetical protein